MGVEFRREVWTLRSQQEENKQTRVKSSNKHKGRKLREENNVMEERVFYYT